MTRSAGFLCCCIVLGCTVVHAQDMPLYKKPSVPVEQRVQDLLKRMTLDEKIAMIGGYDAFFILPNERLGIPKIKMADGPAGVRNYGPSTAFPAPLLVSASWNTDLMHEYGAAIGRDARSRGVHILLGPAMNLYRAPMCGRNFEYLGEDPFLAGRMAAAYVQGLQGQGVVATAKHFAGNNQEWDRNRISSNIDERTLQEIYLPAFKAAVVDGGAGAVMTAYNLVNGVHCSQNDHLVRDILKGQWKFDGLVMSDWGSTYDGVAAANAGLDLEMPGAAFMNRETLLPAIKSGTVRESTIDDKVRRMLRVMFRMGFFDRPQEDPSIPAYSPDSRLAALKTAREGIVLLKNSGNLLPFDRSAIGSIAVIGPGGRRAVTGGGGSSTVEPFRSVSVLDGMIRVGGDSVRVYYNEGLKNDPHRLLATARFGGKADTGLRGEYFDNMTLAGTPVMVRTDKRIDFNWADGPAKNFPKIRYSVRWTGVIQPASSSLYDFSVCGDDGFRLYIDDRLVIDKWDDHGAVTETISRYMRADRERKIRLDYYQNEGGAQISLGWGPSIREVDTTAIALAARVKAAVVCVGFTNATEGEGFDRSFELPPDEEKLVREIAKVNPRTVVVLTAGGNVSMTGWIDGTAAVVHAWYPGQEGGTALAEILFGDVNPSGKLPVSFEKRWQDNACFNSYYDPTGSGVVTYSEGIFLGYRHFDKSGIEPMFPFGYGLSYTTFEYRNLSLSAPSLRKGDKLKARFDVTNTGKREGAEVAQLYIREASPGEPRPVKELKGFAKVALKPGETRNVEIAVDESALSYYSTKKNAWVTDPGEFEVQVGSSSRSILLKKAFSFAADK